MSCHVNHRAKVCVLGEENRFCNEFPAWYGEAITLPLVYQPIDPLKDSIKVFIEFFQSVVHTHPQDSERAVPY